MTLSLMGCSFEHTELQIHFESFNDECAIVKEAQDLFSQESKLMRANFQLNRCPSKFTAKFPTVTVLGHTKGQSHFGLQ